MSDRKPAYLAAFAYSCTIGFSFLFVKIALRSATPLDILAHRFAVALLCALVSLLSGRARYEVKLRDTMSILPLTVFYPVSFFLFQTLGLLHIGSSEAGIVQALVPVFALLLAFPLLGERSSCRRVAFVLLSVTGVALISAMSGSHGGESAAALKGTLLILVATLSMAMYMVITRKLSLRFSVFELTFAMSLAGFVAFALGATVWRLRAPQTTGFMAPFSQPSYAAAILSLPFRGSRPPR